jgi:high-affinity iron transporter
MSKHGRAMAAEVRAVGEAVATGSRTLAALAIVVGVAVLREGSEIVLFLYGIVASGEEDSAAMTIGGLIGVALGGGVTALMYFGLLRIPARHLFSVTGWLITLLAAGMAAQAVAFLQQAGVVTILADTVWDTSSVLADGSLAGKVLHTLVGYTDQPSALQLLVYLLTIGIILSLVRVVHGVGLKPSLSGESVGKP